jgi:ABC-type nickel/cobalt efflux system permease component RcnA
METGLLLIFWYGVLHAFGPDHLTAIADFSIGKRMKRTMMITFAFAIGHGVMLFVFAKVLERFALPESVTAYGDLISSSVIIGIGLYLLYMVVSDKIHLRSHTHEGEEHIHIWFGTKHDHDSNVDTASAFTIGALMGIGGVRGMLVTLGMLEGHAVDLTMVFAFVAGVTLIFGAFGLVILAINKNILTTQRNVRRVFAAAGTVSLAVGTNMILG